MSNTTDTNKTTEPTFEEKTALTEQNERRILMDRARLMKIPFSPNIGLDTLRKRIQEHLESGQSVQSEQSAQPNVLVPAAAASASARPTNPRRTAEARKRQKLQAEALKLVRLRVTCLNPHKRDLPGEIFTVGNRYIGTVRKYVPFGEATDNGWHVPNVIYQHMKSRKFTHYLTDKSGQVVGTRDVPEFALEVLPPLTRQELNRLAQRQAMARGTADDLED